MGKKNRPEEKKEEKRPADEFVKYVTYGGMGALLAICLAVGGMVYSAAREKEKPAAAEYKKVLEVEVLPNAYPLKTCPLNLRLFTVSNNPDFMKPDIVTEYGLNANSFYLAKEFDYVEVNIPDWEAKKIKVAENGKTSLVKNYWYADNKVKPKETDTISVEVLGSRNGKETVIYKGDVGSKR